MDKGWLVVERPLADGGEGTVEVLCKGRGKIIEKEYLAPGEKVKAHIGVVPCSCGEVAVLEMAQVAGLTLCHLRKGISFYHYLRCGRVDKRGSKPGISSHRIRSGVVLPTMGDGSAESFGSEVL